VRRLGVVGFIAKGLVIAGAGVLVIVAASRSVAISSRWE
jgi:hypothetical protein